MDLGSFNPQDIQQYLQGINLPLPSCVHTSAPGVMHACLRIGRLDRGHAVRRAPETAVIITSPTRHAALTSRARTGLVPMMDPEHVYDCLWTDPSDAPSHWRHSRFWRERGGRFDPLGVLVAGRHGTCPLDRTSTRERDRARRAVCPTRA